MSRWLPEQLLRPHELLLGPDGVWDLSDGIAHADFAAWCSAHAGRGCRVNVSSSLVTELPVDPALPLHDDAALIDWARVQLGSLGGDGGNAPDCAAWSAGEVRGVSVLHGIALASLRTQAHTARVRLRCAHPWWSQVLARIVRRHPQSLQAGRSRIVVVEGARIASADFVDARITAVQTRYLDAPSAEALAEWVSAQPAATTTAVGHGLAAGALGAVATLPGLHEPAPTTTWREALR